MTLLDYASGRSAVLAYGAASTILCLNLLVLWVASGAIRAKSGVAINSEDGARFKVPLADFDPPRVARILRAHRNAEAIIYPFLWLGLIFVIAGGSSVLGSILFGVFVVARLAHSGFYLCAKQPWRTVAFVVSLLMAFALLACDIWIISARWRAPH